jgi:hypothetical protein
MIEIGAARMEEMKLALTKRVDSAQHQRVGRPDLMAMANVNSRSP